MGRNSWIPNNIMRMNMTVSRPAKQFSNQLSLTREQMPRLTAHTKLCVVHAVRDYMGF